MDRIFSKMKNMKYYAVLLLILIIISSVILPSAELVINKQSNQKSMTQQNSASSSPGTMTCIGVGSPWEGSGAYFDIHTPGQGYHDVSGWVEYSIDVSPISGSYITINKLSFTIIAEPLNGGAGYGGPAFEGFDSLIIDALSPNGDPQIQLYNVNSYQSVGTGYEVMCKADIPLSYLNSGNLIIKIAWSGTYLTQEQENGGISLQFSSLTFATLTQLTSISPASSGSSIYLSSLTSQYFSISAQDSNGWSCSVQYYYSISGSSTSPTTLATITAPSSSSPVTESTADIPVSELSTHPNEIIMWRYTITSGDSSQYAWTSDWLTGFTIYDDESPVITTTSVTPTSPILDNYQNSIVLGVTGSDASGWKLDISYYYSGTHTTLHPYTNVDSTTLSSTKTLTYSIPRTEWLNHIGETISWSYRATDLGLLSKTTNWVQVPALVSLQDDDPNPPTLGAPNFLNAIGRDDGILLPSVSDSRGIYSVACKYSLDNINFIDASPINQISGTADGCGQYYCNFLQSSSALTIYYKYQATNNDNDRVGERKTSSWVSGQFTTQLFTVEPSLSAFATSLPIMGSSYYIIPDYQYSFSMMLTNNGLSDAVSGQVKIYKDWGTSSSCIETIPVGTLAHGASTSVQSPSISESVTGDYSYYATATLFDGTNTFGMSAAPPSLIVHVQFRDLFLSSSSNEYFYDQFTQRYASILGYFINNVPSTVISSCTLTLKRAPLTGGTPGAFTQLVSETFGGGSGISYQQICHFDTSPTLDLIGTSGLAQGSYRYILSADYTAAGGAYHDDSIPLDITIDSPPTISGIHVVSYKGGTDVDPYVHEDFGFDFTITSPSASTLSITSYKMIVTYNGNSVTYQGASSSFIPITGGIKGGTAEIFTFDPSLYSPINIASQGSVDFSFELLYQVSATPFNGEVFQVDLLNGKAITLNIPPEPVIELVSVTATTSTAPWAAIQYIGEIAPSFPYKTDTQQDNAVTFTFKGSNTGHAPIQFRTNLRWPDGKIFTEKLAQQSEDYTIILLPNAESQVFTITLPVVNHFMKDPADFKTDILWNDVPDMILSFLSIVSSPEASLGESIAELIYTSAYYVANFIGGSAQIHIPEEYYLYCDSFKCLTSVGGINDFDFTSFENSYSSNHIIHDSKDSGTYYGQTIGTYDGPDNTIAVTMTATQYQYGTYWESFVFNIVSFIFLIVADVCKVALTKSPNPIAAIALGITMAVCWELAILANVCQLSSLVSAYEDPIAFDLNSIVFPQPVDAETSSMVQFGNDMKTYYEQVSSIPTEQALYNSQKQSGDLSGAIATGNEISSSAKNIADSISTLSSDEAGVFYGLKTTEANYLTPSGMSLAYTSDNLKTILDNGVPSEYTTLENQINAPQDFKDSITLEFANANPANANYIDMAANNPRLFSSNYIEYMYNNLSIAYAQDTTKLNNALNPGSPTLSQPQLNELDIIKDEITKSFNAQDWVSWSSQINKLEELINNYIEVENVKDPKCFDYLAFILEMREKYVADAGFECHIFQSSNIITSNVGTLQLYIENGAVSARTLLIECDCPDATINFDFTPSVSVDPNEMIQVPISVLLPADYLPNALDFTIKVSDVSNPSVYTTLLVHFDIVHHEVVLNVSPILSKINPGGSATFYCSVKNLGNSIDDYQVEFKPDDFGGEFQANPTSIQNSWGLFNDTTIAWDSTNGEWVGVFTLNPGQNKTVTLSLTVPSSWTAFETTTYSLDMIATLKIDSTINRQASLTLTVISTLQSMKNYVSWEINQLNAAVQASSFSQWAKPWYKCVVSWEVDMVSWLYNQGYTNFAKGDLFNTIRPWLAGSTTSQHGKPWDHCTCKDSLVTDSGLRSTLVGDVNSILTHITAYQVACTSDAIKSLGSEIVTLGQLVNQDLTGCRKTKCDRLLTHISTIYSALLADFQQNGIVNCTAICKLQHDIIEIKEIARDAAISKECSTILGLISTIVNGGTPNGYWGWNWYWCWIYLLGDDDH